MRINVYIGTFVDSTLRVMCNQLKLKNTLRIHLRKKLIELSYFFKYLTQIRIYILPT